MAMQELRSLPLTLSTATNKRPASWKRPGVVDGRREGSVHRGGDDAVLAEGQPFQRRNGARFHPRQRFATLGRPGTLAGVDQGL